MNTINALPTRILLATDGSKDAAFAARIAADLAGRTGAELYVAHAWRPTVQSFGYPTVMWTDYSHLYEREARKLLEAQVDEIEALGVSAEPRLLHGPPVEAILDLCEELEPG
ncbi:MAG: universal stress protein, partial [Rubrobacter sp.]